jgi:hypothetical protein
MITTTTMMTKVTMNQMKMVLKMTADKNSDSSTKRKEASYGSGSKKSSRPSGSSRSGAAGSRKSGSHKRASGELLYREHSCSSSDSDGNCPSKSSDKSGRYPAKGLSTKKERDRHTHDKHSIAKSRHYHSTHPPSKTKPGSDCRRHLEQQHSRQYDEDKGNDKTARTPGQPPQAPTMQHSPSPHRPVPANWGLNRVVRDTDRPISDSTRTRILSLDLRGRLPAIMPSNFSRPVLGVIPGVDPRVDPRAEPKDLSLAPKPGSSSQNVLRSKTGKPVVIRTKRNSTRADQRNSKAIRNLGGQCPKCKKGKRKVRVPSGFYLCHNFSLL